MGNNYTELKVRDYECDGEGIVNNANYLHYLEVARHEMLESLGFDFQHLVDKGINLVVKKIEIEYVQPLRARDIAHITCIPKRISPLRFGFEQNIFRASDNKLMAKAFVMATCINNEGRPFLPPEIDAIF